jgi:phage-related protein
MNTQLEELAAMVLDMRARQQKLYRLEKSRRYKLNLDAEEMARLDDELRELQREVEDECRYILGIEED